jgi:hypothetical protein
MMDCISSNAPSEEELLKHVLDGEMLQEESEHHLEHCEICQQRLAEYSQYSQLNSLLLQQLYRSQCPSIEQLQSFCLRQLPLSIMLSIRNHLQICPLCAEEVKGMQEIVEDGDLAQPTLPRFSSLEIHRAVAQSIVPERELALRGEARNTTTRDWPLRYQVNTINLSLHLSCDSNNDILLLGMISTENDELDIETFVGSKAELYRTVQAEITSGAERALSKEDDPDLMPILKAEVDDLGTLTFRGVPNGSYFMILYLPDIEIVVEDIHIEKI